MKIDLMDAMMLVFLLSLCMVGCVITYCVYDYQCQIARYEYALKCLELDHRDQVVSTETE